MEQHSGRADPACSASRDASRMIRISIFGPLTIEWEGQATPFPAERLLGRGAAPALSLLKALLCQPHRFALRDWLMEQFWPNTTRSRAEERLDDVASGLRTLLRPPESQAKILHYVYGGPGSGSGYRLEGYPYIWVDADAFVWNVEQAARMERFGDDPLPLWERAYELAKCGTFLPEEVYSDWAKEWREVLEGHYRQCVHRLAHVLRERGAHEEALLRLRTYWQAHSTDEDALRPLMECLGEQERYQEAEEYYQQCMLALEEVESGRRPDPRTQDIHEFLHTKQIQRNRKAFTPVLLDVVPIFKYTNAESTTLSQFTTAISQGIILAARQLGKEEIHPSLTADLHRLQRKASLDILGYKRNIRLALHLHRTSTAQGLLQDVNADIQDLEQLERQARGHDLYWVKELLIGNHLLATKIVKDQRQYAHAYTYANNAVLVATSLEDGDLIAMTKYTRGCVKLEWAQFGAVKQGMLQLNKEKVRDAIRDFQNALNMAHVQRTPLHPQLHGFTCLQLGRAYSLLHDAWDGSAETNPLIFVDQAESMVGCASIEDAYTRLVITGTVSGLHWGAYHLNKTEIFIAMRMQDQALAELKRLRQLTERTYAQDETRNQAWSNVVMAEVLMGLEAYPEVTSTLRSALLACRSINSIQNAATIIDIHGRLVISSYGTSTDVQELGAMLKEWYGIA
jgi:DNA-binding SARP family transcriptional activator